jgi:hypothetical protein
MDVRLPDGRIVTNVPEGTTKSQLMAKLDKTSNISGNDAGPISAAIGGFNTALPFGRKITSAIGAGIAKASGVDDSFSNLYNQAEADAQVTADANPVASGVGLAAGIGNSLLLGSARSLFGSTPSRGIRGSINAIPETLSKIGNFAGRSEIAGSGALANAGNFALRSAKGAAVAAPTGALYGAGEAASGNEIEGAKAGAGLAAAVGATLPVSGAVLAGTRDVVKDSYKGFKARDVEQLQEAAAAIKDRSFQAYNQMRQAGAVFKPEKANKIVDDIYTRLTDDGILNPRLHDKTLGLFEDFKDAASQGDLGLESLDQWRQLFGEVAGNFNDRVNARKASKVIGAIDNAVDNIQADDLVNGSKEAVDALKLGRSEWAKSRKFETITDIVKKSDGDANYLKRELKKLVDNPKKSRGFSPEEFRALQDAATLSTSEGILKSLGKFGFDFGNSRIGNTALPVIGGLAGSPVLPAVGTAARSAQKLTARGKVEDLLKVIEKGGNISMTEINSLPPRDAIKLIDRLKGIASNRLPLVVEVTPRGKR